MKGMNCNIIKDILPLYVDNVVGEDTKKLVEAHLENCEACRKEAALLKKEVMIPESQAARVQDAEPLKAFKKKWRNKKAIVSLLSVVVAVGIMIGLLSFMTYHYSVVPYDSSLITVEETDGQVYAVYHGDSVGKIAVIDPTSVQMDGTSKKVVVFYYSETLWSRYIEPLFHQKNEDTSRGYRYLLGASDQIDRVFYGGFDSQNAFSDLPQVLEDATLAWSD